MQISDEILAKSCHAAECDADSPTGKRVKAALTAVLPMIRAAVVEECAKIVDAERNKPGLVAGSETSRDRAVRIGWLIGGQHFAAAIRELEQKP